MDDRRNSIGERSFLLGRKELSCCSSLKRKYKYTFLTSKHVVLYLTWIGVFFTLLGPVSTTLQLVHLKAGRVRNYVFNFVDNVFLFYPVFGYIGEKWTRYYIIMTGVMIICGTAFLVAIIVISFGVQFFDAHQHAALSITALVVLSLMLSQGILGANFIQFGLDQMQSAPSQELASYARWSVFVLFLAFCISFTIGNILDKFSKFTNLVYTLGPIFVCLTVGCAIFGFCLKCLLIIEPPPAVDPLKLNWKVIKYAWNHKNPVNRSAFTYNDDPPSRLDFGKNRYGGPFTTDEVEDIKSFWNVLAVTLSSTLFSNFDFGEKYLYQLDERNVSLSISESVLFYSSSQYLILLIIPALQFLIVPFFPCLILSILKRIWIGLALSFFSFLTATIIGVYLDHDPEHLVESLVFVGMLNGIGSAVVVFSSLEFIFAQAPCRMQGLLVGFWFIQFATQNVLLSINHAILVYYSAATGLTLLSLIMFSVAMYRYKYRVRNEPSDINVRSTIEEIYEKNLMTQSEDSSIIN